MRMRPPAPEWSPYEIDFLSRNLGWGARGSAAAKLELAAMRLFHEDRIIGGPQWDEVTPERRAWFLAKAAGLVAGPSTMPPAMVEP